MTTRECVIRNRLGLHARAAVSREGKTMDGKSIMGILLLAAGAGMSIVITAEGSDETGAVDALCHLVDSGFGEEPWNA